MIAALDGSSALQWIRYRNVVEIHNGGFLHGTATNIMLPISNTWQSHVKNNDSSQYVAVPERVKRRLETSN